MKQFSQTHTNIAKGIAVLLLLFYHLFPTTELILSMNISTFPFSSSTLYHFASFGNICVPIFVFLTAYGITASFLSKTHLTTAEIFHHSTSRFFKLMLNFLALYCSFNFLWFYKFDYPLLYGTSTVRIVYQLSDALGLAHLFSTPTFNMTWWYMNIAYAIIFIVPCFYVCLKKLGTSSIPLFFLFPFIISIHADLFQHWFSIILGTSAAYYHWFDKLLSFPIFFPNLTTPNSNKWKGIFHYLLLLIAGVLFFLLSFMYRGQYETSFYLYFIKGISGMGITFFSATIFYPIPLFNKILAFIGSHSLNIFLIHTFFYMILWKNYIYYFPNAWIIFLFLLTTSLIYSIILEWIKKFFITKFNKKY